LKKSSERQKLPLTAFIELQTYILVTLQPIEVPEHLHLLRQEPGGMDHRKCHQP